MFPRLEEPIFFCFCFTLDVKSNLIFNVVPGLCLFCEACTAQTRSLLAKQILLIVGSGPPKINLFYLEAALIGCLLKYQIHKTTFVICDWFIGNKLSFVQFKKPLNALHWGNKTNKNLSVVKMGTRICDSLFICHKNQKDCLSSCCVKAELCSLSVRLSCSNMLPTWPTSSTAVFKQDKY